MSSELLYTSAPQGLKGGSRGFTTVLCTAGMPPNLADKLESFSGYKHVYSPQDSLAEHNPVRYAYLRPSVGGRTLAVVSRLAAYGVDYSGRTNKIAHHLVLENSERPSGGPAWLLSQNNLWKASWDGQCKTLPTGPQIPLGDRPPSVCRQWQAALGDAGWGGQLVTWLKQSTKPIWLIYEPTQHVQLLNLLVEAFSLLPEAERWKYTFATYFSGLPGDVDCRIRGVVSGSDEARLASARGHVIDLTREAPLASGSIWIEAARTGIVPSMPAAAPAIPGLPPDPDTVLGDWESAPAVTSPASASTWLDEPPPVGFTGTEKRDFSLDTGDYQLAPPPMPVARASKNKPPSLPKPRRSTDESHESALRWVIPAVVAALVLLILGGIGLIVYQQPQILSNLRAKSEPPKPTTEAVPKEELAQKKPEVAEVNQEKAKNADEDHSEKPSKEPPVIVLKKDGQPDQSWTGESGNSFELSIPENLDGETGYKLSCDENPELEMSFNDNVLSIVQGKIIVNKKQDYEGPEWKTNPRKLELSVKVNNESTIIKVNIKLIDETNYFDAKPVELFVSTDSNQNISFDLNDHHKDKMTEEDVPKFVFLHQGIAEKSIVGNYGEINITDSLLTYKLDSEKIKKATDRELEETFTYQAQFTGGKPDSANKIRIVITNNLSFNWLATRTRDGSELRFKKDEIKKLFKGGGNFLVSFRHDGTMLGQPAEIQSIQEGGTVNVKNNRAILAGVGTLSVYPNSNEISSMKVEHPELRKNLENLCGGNEKLFSIFQQKLREVSRDQETRMDELDAQIASLAENAKKEKEKERKKLNDLISVLQSLDSRINAHLKSISKKESAEAKRALPGKTLKELLETDVETPLVELIKSLDEENSDASSVLHDCKADIIKQINDSKFYIRKCNLVGEKKGESMFGSGVDTQGMKLGPLGDSH